MSGSLSYLGSLSLGACIPTQAVTLQASLAALQGQLAGLLNVQIALTASPPSITALAQMAAALSAAIAAPTFSLQVNATVALIAQIQLQIAGIQAQLSALAAAGIFLYAYDGDVGSLGSSLSTSLASGLPGGGVSDHCNALVLTTELAATWTAMGTVMKTA